MHSSGGLFPHVSRNLRQLLHAPASWGWIGGVLGVQALVASAGGTDAVSGWYETFGLSRDGFLSGKVWQMLAYCLLHAGWWHAGLNALFVLAVGPRIEHMVGSRVMVRATLAGVVGGGLCHLLLGTGVLVGLSGGCMALLLLLTTLSPQSRMLPLPVSARSLGWGVLLAEMLLALSDPALGAPGLSRAGRLLTDHGLGGWFQIGHACHFGGGLAGWLYGRWWLRPRVTLDRLRRERARREAH